MRERQDRLFGVTRLHTPSTDEPLIVVMVDELAALTAWVNDRAIKKRIESALGLLLSQGRAVGVVVVGAIQDPRKDVLPQRDLFPIRIGLRLNEAEHIDLTLGRAARLRGAACDMIPDTLPGVGYVQVDGIAEPVRVRFAHPTDARPRRPRPTPTGPPSPSSRAAPPDDPARLHHHRRRRPGAGRVGPGVRPPDAAPGPRPGHRDGGGGADPVRVHPGGGLPGLRPQGPDHPDPAVHRGLAPHRRTRAALTRPAATTTARTRTTRTTRPGRASGCGRRGGGRTCPTCPS